MRQKVKEDELLQRIDRLIRLVIVGLCEGKSQKDQIRILDAAGIPPKEIAHLLGTTRNTVNVALSNIRKFSKRAMSIARTED